MQGSISFDGTLAGSIAGGGGGGGSDVTITPRLESGTKIADFTIDDTAGELYAPTPGQPIVYTAGTNIQISEENVISATDTTYTAGNNITIENGVISATGGSGINYSLDEMIIGSWIDGKPIYRKGFHLNSLTYSTNWVDFNHNISNIKRVIKTYGNLINNDNGQLFAIPIFRSNTNQGIIIAVSDTKILYINNWLKNAKEIYIFIEYTKTTD